MSNINLTSGYSFATTTNPGEVVTYAKLNALVGAMIGVVPAGTITDTEMASVGGTKVLTGTLPLSALNSAAQSRISGGIKNFIPNSQFNEWPNTTSIALQSGGTYNSAGAWQYYNAGSITGTISQQAITPGASDTYCRDAKYWYQFATTNTGSSAIYPLQIIIPNGRLFSGQSVTLSLAAQVNSGTLPTMTCQITQYFGTGGSPSSNVVTTGTFNAQPTGTISQINSTIAVPSVSGKTFGTNGDDYIQVQITIATPSTTFTLNVTNVQLELGSVATTFENSLDRPTGQVWSYANVNGGRITLTSGTPVLSSNISTAATIYFTPHVHNIITLFNINGADINLPFLETSISISSATGATFYYIYSYNNGGVLALEYNTTTPTKYYGMDVKTGDISRRLIGGFYCNTNGNTFFYPQGNDGNSYNGIGIINNQNIIKIQCSVISQVSSWSYTSGGWRQPNASGAWGIRVCTLKPSYVPCKYTVANSAAGNGNIAISVGSTTTPDTNCKIGLLNSTSNGLQVYAEDNALVSSIGSTYVTPLDYWSSSTVTITGYNTVNSVNYPVTQFTAILDC